MKKSYILFHTRFFITALLCLLPSFIFAQNRVIDASTLIPHVEITLSPQQGTFTEGSTFDVPILLNTKGISVNGIDVKISFDPNRLAIVQPSGGQSIIGVWVQPPTFDNVRGTINYVGVVTNGITTNSGLIGTITFKAKIAGNTTVSIKSDSSVLLNDGSGTQATLDLGRGEYSIIPKAPEGVRIYSQTHPFSANWYNNNNPIISWDQDAGVTGFSYVLDDKPSTIPDNTIMTTNTTKAYEKLPDGLWYFHVKAFRNGVWGTTGNFLLRIDTTPPAEFTPQVNYVVASIALIERALVSFFTTDSLSGIDHYEVGVIDKSQDVNASPVFVNTESPYQVATQSKAGLRVIIRAVDRAGNVRDESIDVARPFIVSQFVKDYLYYILAAIVLIALLALIFHYLFGHHILSRLKRAFVIAEEEEISEEQTEENPPLGVTIIEDKSEEKKEPNQP